MTRPIRLLIIAGALLAVASCGTTGGSPAALVRTQAKPHGTACGGGFPARHAWLTSLTSSGRRIWQVPLATTGNSVSARVAPIVMDGMYVTAQDGVVHGIAAAGGRALWRWAGGQEVYGMWRYGATVAVLTDQVSPAARITALDAATGKVRWSAGFGTRGLAGNQALTRDGAVVVVRADGVLQVINLSDGRTRWSVRTGVFPTPVVAGDVVAAVSGGRVTGYSAATGSPLWTTRGLGTQPVLAVGGGKVLVTAGDTVTAIDPVSGHVAWRFNPGTTPAIAGAGADGVLVASYDPRRVFFIDAASGRVRWSAATFAGLDATASIGASGVLTPEGNFTSRLTDRVAATGAVHWRSAVAGLGSQVPVLADGGDVIAVNEPAGVGGPATIAALSAASGALAWRATVPSFVNAPPVVTSTGILIQSADPPYGCAATGTAIAPAP